MKEGGNYCAADTVVPFVVAFTERSFGSSESCNLTRMNVLSSETVRKLVSDQRGRVWVEGNLVRLRSLIWKLKSVVKKTFGLHCSSDLFTLELHLLTVLWTV